MKRGTTIKRQSGQSLAVERRMVVKHDLLELRRDQCLSCELCATACPQGAIGITQPVVAEGRLLAKPVIDVDASRCNFCGECVVLCPSGALRLTTNGEPRIPVVEYGVFPTLTREIAVDVEQCRPDCGLACEEVCPTRCVKVVAEREAEGRVSGIVDVAVDREHCLYCVECAEACPQGAITVARPWEGRLLVNAARCPAGCQACADICPTSALEIKEGQMEADPRFCLFCGACQKVCPAEGALTVERRRVRHADVKSGAWSNALEQLISVQAKREDLETKAQSRRRKALHFVPGVNAQ